MARRVTFYQKPTCSTCRKARSWLQSFGDLEVIERDILLTPPPHHLLDAHVQGEGEELRRYLNPRSAAYRRHRLAVALPDRGTLLGLLAEEPDLIRRPMVVRGKKAVFGMDEGALRDLIE